MNDLENALREIFEKYNEQMQGKKIFLFGCSLETSVLIEYFKAKKEIAAILDNHKRKEKTRWQDVEVRMPEYCLAYPYDYCVIIWSVYAEEMFDQLIDIGCKRESIIRIDICRDSEEFLDYKMRYMESAYTIYEGLVKNHGNSLFLIAPRASGDTYIGLSHIKAWKEKYQITESVVVVGSAGNLLDLLVLFHYKDYEILKEDERRKLIFLFSLMGEKIHLKMIAPWELNIRNSFFPHEGKSITFVDKFKYEVFQLSNNDRAEYPQYRKMEEKADYVVLAPYAYSTPAPNLSIGFWEKLTKKLVDKNYKVYTVGYNNREPAVKGTEEVRFSYKDAGTILGKSQGFISARSGLCDIVHNVWCRQFVLFSNRKRPFATSFYGMKENYWDYRGEEICCDDLPEEKIINMIIERLRQ